MFTRNQKHKVKLRFEIGITEVVNLPSEVEGQSIHLEWRRSKKPGQFGETSKVIATKNQLMSGSSKNTASVPSSASFPSSEQIVLLSRISLEATTNKFEKKEIKFTLFATKTTSSSQKDSKKLKKLFTHSSSSSSSSSSGSSITTTTTLGTAKIDLAEFAKNGTSTTKFIPLGKKNPPSLVLTFNTKWLKVNNKDLVDVGASGSGGSKLSLTPQSQTLNLFGVEYHLKTSDTISEADTSVGELSDDEDEGDVFAAGDKEKDNLPPASSSSATTITVPKEKKKGSRILGWTTASLPSSVVIAHTQQPVPTPDLPPKSETVPSSHDNSTSWKPSKPRPSSKGSENSGEVEKLKTRVKELEEQLETSKKVHQKGLGSLESETVKLSSDLQQLIASSKAKNEEKEREKEKEEEEEKALHSRIAHANTELLELRGQFKKAGERLEEETILRIQLEKQVEDLLEELERMKHAVTDKEEEKVLIVDEEEALKKKLKEEAESKAALNEETTALRNELQELREQLENEKKTKKEEFERVNEENELLRRTLEEARSKKEEKNQETKTSEEPSSASQQDDEKKELQNLLEQLQSSLAVEATRNAKLEQELINLKEKENKDEEKEQGEGERQLQQEVERLHKENSDLATMVSELEAKVKETEGREPEAIAKDNDSEKRAFKIANEDMIVELERKERELCELKEELATEKGKPKDEFTSSFSSSSSLPFEVQLEILKKDFEEKEAGLTSRLGNVNHEVLTLRGELEAKSKQLETELTFRSTLERQAETLMEELERTKKSLTDDKEVHQRSSELSQKESEDSKAAQKTLEDTLKKLTLTLNLNKEELKKAESSSKKYRNRQNGLETQLKELELRLSNSEKAREDSEGRLDALKEHTLHLKEQLANAVSSLAPSVSPSSSFSSGSGGSVTSLSSILAEIPPQLAGLVVLCLILSHLLAFQLG